MRTRGRLAVALVLAVLGAGVAGAQTVSQREEIAVFSLSHHRWNVPWSALGAIDDQIRAVFINLGRFDVIGMAYQLDAEDAQAFIDAITSFREQNLEIPESVQMGREYLTQADVTRLVAGFVVIIPSVTDYHRELVDDGWKVDIRTSFTFLDVAAGASFAQFSVQTSGTDADEDRAVRKAVDAIPLRLTYEVRRIDRFTLRTGILEVRGSEVVIELGSRMGVKPGDEYLVLSPRVLSSGKEVVTEKGLIVVRRVEEEVSYATVVYVHGGLEPGEQLKELPRVGLETEVYGRGMAVGTWFLPEDRPITIGARVTLARGFEAFRPFVVVELPLHLFDDAWGMPLNVSLGAEYGFGLGRLRIAPFVEVGLALDVKLKEGEYPEVMLFGGAMGVQASWFLTRNLRLAAEAGAAAWRNNARSYLNSAGVFAGAGIVVKY
jgi:hypothetical protein